MKYLFISILATIIISCSGGQITIFKETNFGKEDFSNKNIIVTPLTGEWIFVGKESSFYDFPEAHLYTRAFINKLKELRPCINIVVQSRLDYSAPDLERTMNLKKYCFNKMSREDSAYFHDLSITFDADYLIFFESVEFFTAQKEVYQVQIGQKESKLIIQLWDLKKCKMVYRVQTKGDGLNIKQLLIDDSSTEAVENSFEEYIESLPICAQNL